MIKYSTILIFALITCKIQAQTGHVETYKDPRIDALVLKQSEIIPPDIHPKIDGYRVQVYFDASRTEINKAKTTFIAMYPDVETYVEFSAPNYYLKVGDFRTKLEAERVKMHIAEKFPTSFVIKDKINLPKVDEDPTDRFND